jgi:cytochrome c biogenesis protein CcmG/thiol:disulfide interchange protein DsbE
LPAVAFLALAALFYGRLHAGDPSAIPSALIGKPAPQFDLPALAGVEAAGGGTVPGLATADLKDGQPTLVNIFASWCAPCREENPVLLRLGAMPGVRLVGIDYKDEPGNAVRFLNGLGNPYRRIGVDRSGTTGIDWGVYGVPETFVVDGTGRITFKHVGPLTPEAVTAELLPQLAKARSAGSAAQR